jgi:V/A-type H+-transporting ATPase subunit F
MEERLEKKYRIAMVGNEQLVLGFKLAGVVESYVISGQQHAESTLKKLLERGDVGIIIMSSGVKRQVRDRRLMETIDESILPLVVEVPEKGEGVTEEDTLRNLILRAIGIDISRMFKNG